MATSRRTGRPSTWTSGLQLPALPIPTNSMERNEGIGQGPEQGQRRSQRNPVDLPYARNTAIGGNPGTDSSSSARVSNFMCRVLDDTDVTLEDILREYEALDSFTMEELKGDEEEQEGGSDYTNNVQAHKKNDFAKAKLPGKERECQIEKEGGSRSRQFGDSSCTFFPPIPLDTRPTHTAVEEMGWCRRRDWQREESDIMYRFQLRLISEQMGAWGKSFVAYKEESKDALKRLEMTLHELVECMGSFGEKVEGLKEAVEQIGAMVETDTRRVEKVVGEVEARLGNMEATIEAIRGDFERHIYVHCQNGMDKKQGKAESTQTLGRGCEGEVQEEDKQEVEAGLDIGSGIYSQHKRETQRQLHSKHDHHPNTPPPPFPPPPSLPTLSHLSARVSRQKSGVKRRLLSPFYEHSYSEYRPKSPLQPPHAQPQTLYPSLPQSQFTNQRSTSCAHVSPCQPSPSLYYQYNQYNKDQDKTFELLPASFLSTNTSSCDTKSVTERPPSTTTGGGGGTQEKSSFIGASFSTRTAPQAPKKRRILLDSKEMEEAIEQERQEQL